MGFPRSGTTLAETVLLNHPDIESLEERNTLHAGILDFLGQPSDIAGGVVYLCSDAARFITGAELVIDGGVFAG